MKKLLLALLLLIAAPSWGATIFACSCASGSDIKCVAGNDSNDGLTDITPKQTLIAALGATGAAPRVLKACTGGAWSNVSTTLSVALTIDSYEPKTCKEGCRLKKPIFTEARSGQTALTISGGSGFFIRNLNIRGEGAGQSGIASSVSSVEIDRVQVSGFQTAGIACTAGTGFVLKNSTLTDNTEGAVVACAGRVEGNRFDNNASSFCQANAGTCTTKHALRLVGAFGGNGTVGIVAQHNEFTRTGNLVGSRCATPVIAAHGRHKGLTIENNEITETNPTAACWGITLEDGYASGAGIEGFVQATIRSNTIANVGGVGIGASSCQGCYIDNNVVVRNSDLGTTAAADDFVAIRTPGKPTGSGDLVNDGIWVRNNSIYFASATAGSKAIQMQDGQNHGVSSNLIELAASNTATQCFDFSGTSFGDVTVIDYNLCHRVSGLPKWSQEFATITIARAQATPRDEHGSSSDPMLLAEPKRSTRWSMAVNEGSPAINNGDSGRAARIAYQGHPKVLTRDMGAFEFEAQGKIYFVANNGSNSNNGLSVNSPFQTIGFAKNLVNPGDTIEIRAGTYNESLLISRPGSSVARITMRGYNGERPILRGTGTGPTLYFYTQACEDMVEAGQSGNTDCTPMYWTVSGLEIRGSATGGGDGNVVKIDTPKVRLQGNRLCCSFADVVKLVRTANDAEVIDNEIWQDAAVTPISENAQGVDSVGTDRIRIAGNYVHDITSIGMYCKGNCRNAVFENNLIVNIGDHAMMMGQETDEELLLDGEYEAYDGVMRNNVVMHTDRACAAVSSAQNIKVLNNSCYDTGRVQHGSIFLSNESIVGQASENVEIANNIVYGSVNLPVVKMTADAFDDFGTLNIHDNIYWTVDGAPRFHPNSEFSPVNAATWFTEYEELTGHTDNSRVLNPKFETFVGNTPMTLASDSPAINAGVANAAVTKDFKWVSRPQGPKPEIGAYEFTRTALVDTVPPTLVSTSPGGGSSFVAIGSSISANFSEAVNCASVTTATFGVSGGVTGTISCDGATAIFTPSANFAYSTTYTVTLSTSITDFAGNNLGGTRVWTFTTVQAPATGFDFDFLVYGDSRAGNICGGNNVHAGLVTQMAAETGSFVVHVGDMIAGLYNTTNWTQRGGCPGDSDRGSLSQMIAPLKSKTPAAGLPAYFFPVIGNHDAGWGSGWYPDPYGEGVCSVFDIQALGIPNHTRMSYFLDQTTRVPHYTDAEFYTLACSTTSPAVYDTFMYYTFRFKNSQFVIMRLNDDNHNVMDCNTCDGALSNYDHYYYKHQLDWLNYVLNIAQNDVNVQNVFVFTHAPLVTRSEHPAVASYPTLRYTFSNYNKVKMVFSGHNHVYERSYPVKATVANPEGVRDDANGVVYFTTGGGGSPGNDFIRTEPLMAIGLAPYHYMKVSVNGSVITTKAIKQDGSVMDQYTR